MPLLQMMLLVQASHCLAMQMALFLDQTIGSQYCHVLQDRVAKLQELYMRDLDQSKAITTVHEDMQQSNLLQLATPEMLAVSTPPAEFPVPSGSKSMQILPALHEIEALRRERDALQGQVSIQ